MLKFVSWLVISLISYSFETSILFWNQIPCSFQHQVVINFTQWCIDLFQFWKSHFSKDHDQMSLNVNLSWFSCCYKIDCMFGNFKCLIAQLSAMALLNVSLFFTMCGIKLSAIWRLMRYLNSRPVTCTSSSQRAFQS